MAQTGRTQPRFQVLIVCSANICRSPSAQYLLGAELARCTLESAPIDVVSAGTAAVSAHEFCSASASLLGIDSAIPFARTMFGAQVTQEMLDSASVILVMQREHRSHVARMRPGSAKRTFTLRESVGLATWLLDREPGFAAASEGCIDRLDLLVTRMNQARGMWVPEPERRGRWANLYSAKTPQMDPLDIPDPHGDDVSHGRALELIRSAVTELADIVGRVCTS